MGSTYLHFQEMRCAWFKVGEEFLTIGRCDTVRLGASGNNREAFAVYEYMADDRDKTTYLIITNMQGYLVLHCDWLNDLAGRRSSWNFARDFHLSKVKDIAFKVCFKQDTESITLELAKGLKNLYRSGSKIKMRRGKKPLVEFKEFPCTTTQSAQLNGPKNAGSKTKATGNGDKSCQEKPIYLSHIDLEHGDLPYVGKTLQMQVFTITRRLTMATFQVEGKAEYLIQNKDGHLELSEGGTTSARQFRVDSQRGEEQQFVLSNATRGDMVFTEYQNGKFRLAPAGEVAENQVIRLEIKPVKPDDTAGTHNLSK